MFQPPNNQSKPPIEDSPILLGHQAHTDPNRSQFLSKNHGHKRVFGRQVQLEKAESFSSPIRELKK